LEIPSADMTSTLKSNVRFSSVANRERTWYPLAQPGEAVYKGPDNALMLPID
jgi:hypothetical protein